MMEMLKSKSIIVFIIFMLGVALAYCPTNKLDNNDVNQEYVYANIK